MKRIVPPALLALAALVVLPTRTTSTTSPALSRAPAGIDRSLLGFAPNALAKPDEAGAESPLIALAPVLAHAPADIPGKVGSADPVQGEAALPMAVAAKDGGTTPRSAGTLRGAVTPAGESTALAWMTPTGFQVVIGKGGEMRRVFVGLIEPAHLEREEHCLAQAVYFEARSEVEEGRAAVAQVVLNRVKSGAYPTTVCGVVFQNRHRKLACQFTFACEGKALRITEPEAWKAALRIARDVYEGKIYLSEVGDATHYHADYVQPGWAKKLKKMDVIGRHVFYS